MVLYYILDGCPCFFLIATSVNFLDLFIEFHDSLLQKRKKKKQKPTSSIKNITQITMLDNWEALNHCFGFHKIVALTHFSNVATQRMRF